MDVRLRVSPSEITFNNKTYDLDSVARSVSAITKLTKLEVISCEVDFCRILILNPQLTIVS